MAAHLLEVRELVKHYPITKGVVFKKKLGIVKAVDGINFTLEKGKTLGLVGETGSGKTTTGRLILRLVEPTAGTIQFDEMDISKATGKQLQSFRKRTAIVFQDPFASLDPRRRVLQIVEEPMAIQHWEGSVARRRAYDLLERVGLGKENANKYPHQFSGGQRQRIAIARALALSPELVIADEAVSGLDVSVQARIINLLIDLQREFNLAYLFIAHDLGVVRQISDEVAVMYLGKIVEYGRAQDVFDNPLHPYTQALLSAIPIPNPALMKARKPQVLKGEIPSPTNPPLGCRFVTRCPFARELCIEKEPPLMDSGNGHLVSCHFWQEIMERNVVVSR